jgi:hypothetical protein
MECRGKSTETLSQTVGRIITGSLILACLFLGGCSDGTSDALSDGETVPVTITVTPDSHGIVVGEALQFTATGTFEDSATQDITSSVQWKSSDAGVASIDSTGLVTALSAGTTTITATSGGAHGSAELEVLVRPPSSSAIIIDHTCIDLWSIPEQWISKAKADLRIAYGYTSHGHQLIAGMSGLYSWQGSLYAFGEGGTGGALDLRHIPYSLAYDLGNPDRTTWANATRTYLDANPEINVIIWAWCGQVSSATVTDINTYLSLMTELEEEYPGVKFVYMTGHLDGSGLRGNLHLRNNQIRDYCQDNDKVLYDFEDIESYDPDGTYFGDKYPNDACYYDSNGDGTRNANWAIQWQDAHTLGVDWFDCSADHTQPLNGNLKAYAAWWLWARLAGWGD